MFGKKSTDHVRPWLMGFVESLGEREATRLLEGVGVLEPLLNVSTNFQLGIETTKSLVVPSYQVGDVVQANYKGDGYWYWAEISKVHSNGYYNIFFLGDCSEEIATFDERLRRTGEADDSTDYEIDLKEIALSRVVATV